MVNIEKIDRLALLALGNAIRLHDDAIHLYNDQRYPAAFLLSVLSQEEIGKAHIAAEFVWTSRDYRSRKDGSEYNQLEEEKFLELLYKHPIKQGSFLRHSDKGMRLLRNEKGRKIYQDVFDGMLEAEKQKAAYVGLKRYKGKIDPKGKIQRPNNISQRHAKAQISNVHDYLVDICAGTIADVDHLEISNAKKIFNRRFYKKLVAVWPIGKEVEKHIINREKFLKKEGLKPLKI